MMTKIVFAVATLATGFSFAATQTSKEYVDTRDAATLQTAKTYSDGKADYVQGLIPSTNDFLAASWTNSEDIVFGRGANAVGGQNIAIGKNASANGQGAFAVGSGSSIGTYAMAFGGAEALANYCLAMGMEAEAREAYALAIGNGARACSGNTVAVGNNSFATNANAFAIGLNAQAKGLQSIAIGNESIARERQSAAIGYGAETFGWSSSAFGVYATANGLSAVAVGTNPLAYGQYSTAIGMQAIASNSYTVAIGNSAQAISSGAVAIGSSTRATNNYAVAIGQSAKAGNNGLAFGYGAEAGTQSVAIGREAKARHTASVAIGPTATTTADGTFRIAYSPSEIYLGFFQPKSLQAYFNELTPTIDWGIASNIVRNAEFLPSKYYNVYRGTTNLAAKWQWNSLGYNNRYSTTLSLLPANEDSLVDLEIGDGAMISFENGGRLNVSNGGEIWVPNPDAITFGSGQNQTNFNNYVKAIAQREGGAVKSVNNKTGNVTLNATDVGAATTAELDATKAIVYTWENFLDGSNVVFSITNYISGSYNLGTAKFRILEMTNGVYREVYNSRDEIIMHIDNFKTNDFRVATNAVISSVDSKIANKADKAWGRYTSTGGEAPSNTVVMTEQYTKFAGGTEYYRFAVGEGMISVLTTCGAPTYTTGDEGTFKFQDDGGTNYFGFAKSDSYVIGCNTDGISVQNNIVTLTYNVTMSGVPCIWYKEDLSTNTPWEQLNLPDGTAIAGASHVVTWEGSPSPGTEVCYINCPEPKGFFKATIEVAGSAKFMTNMPAYLGGGIICTNTSTGVNGIIRPSFNGSTVIWTWSAQ